MQITISGLTKIFRNGTVFRNSTVALDGIDLTVTHGMHGLLGANGAGKTTLLRILAGLVRPTGGQVVVGGNDLSADSGRRAVQRGLGYLPQDMGVYPELSARRFLDYIALLKGLDDTATRRRRVGEMLEVVGLTTEADRSLKGFSGGMRRRIGIAQALLTDPRLLIVDEPTAGLDPVERIRFRTLLARLAENRTVLLSTHIVEDIAQTCGDLTVLDKGRVRFHGTAADLVTRGSGHVWSVTTPGTEPGSGTIVSALPDGPDTRFRVVCATPPDRTAAPVEPTLEDGYLALVCAPALDGIRP